VGMGPAPGAGLWSKPVSGAGRGRDGKPRGRYANTIERERLEDAQLRDRRSKCLKEPGKTQPAPWTASSVPDEAAGANGWVMWR